MTAVVAFQQPARAPEEVPAKLPGSQQQETPRLVATGLVALVALLHSYFMLLEMVFWAKPPGRKAFRLTIEAAEDTKSLAANQSLYNGFLVAGLLWGAIAASGGPATALSDFAIEVFFLACIVVAGVFGAITVSHKIFFVQALPGALAPLCVLLGHIGR